MTTTDRGGLEDYHRHSTEETTPKDEMWLHLDWHAYAMQITGHVLSIRPVACAARTGARRLTIVDHGWMGAS